jgi:hypothetical protein
MFSRSAGRTTPVSHRHHQRPPESLDHPGRYEQLDEEERPIGQK